MIRKFRDPKLLVATHNFGKLEEIRDLLTPYGVAVTGAAELDLPEPEETETSFIGNARIKATLPVWKLNSLLTVKKW